MYTRQSVAGKAQERAADEVRASLDHECSCPQQDLCILMEFSARGGAVPPAWTRRAAFTGVPARKSLKGPIPEALVAHIRSNGRRR